MKRQNIFLSSMALLAVAALSGCATQKTTPTPTSSEKPVAVAPQPTVQTAVAANKELMSIDEAAGLLLQPDNMKAVASKYGYTTINGYAIHRLDTYDKMLYRNCKPAKQVSKGVYADTPQPMRRGTSSYVAVGPGITIGVFNAAAYQNLVDQVKGLGYTLAEQGYEDHYTNGTIDIYCYAARKTVRLEKAAN